MCDFPGNEKYASSVGINYLRNTLGVFIVFDITDRDSFKEVEKWSDMAKAYNDSTLIMCLIGNKVDLRDPEKAHEQVSEDEIMVMCEKIGATFYAQTCAVKKEFDIIEVRIAHLKLFKRLYSYLGGFWLILA